MDNNSLEKVQLKILYAGVYLSLGLIGPSQLEILDHETSVLRKQTASLKQYSGIQPKHLFPRVERVSHEFHSNLHGLAHRTVVHKWRWMTRDSSDKLLLRFIRRYRNLKRAAACLAHSLYMQTEKCDVELELSRGERYYIDQEPNEAYIEMLAKQKVLFCGADKRGRPLMVVRIREHLPRKQSRQTAAKLLAVALEHLLITQNEEEDGSTVIFDMEGFTFENWDLDHGKDMIEWAMKAYPGLFTRLYIHRAPKIYEGLWYLLKNVMDSHLRRMFKFSYTVKDLEDSVYPENLPKFMGGESIHSGEWTEPRKEDAILCRDHKGLSYLTAERNKLHGEIEQLTRNWIMAHDNYIQRQNCLARTRTNYWQLDPYLRARTVWDRQGVLSVTRPELAPGGISHVGTIVSRLTYTPKPPSVRGSKLSAKSSPQDTPTTSILTPSINSMSIDSVAPLSSNS